jgi:membrane protease YdiL (CAAX protease family)
VANYIRGLTPRAEFWIVVLAAFGYPIFSNILVLLVPHTGHLINESHLYFLLIYESAVMLVLWKFLSLRGWNLGQLGMAFRATDIAAGFGLALGAHAVNFLIMAVVIYFFPVAPARVGSLVAPGIDLSAIITVSILNPVFEEVFVCGYVMTALRKHRSSLFAANVSFGLRLAYHLYQGAFRMLGIIAFSAIFTLWFAKKGRLWPLIVAHAVIDFTGLWVASRLG